MCLCAHACVQVVDILMAKGADPNLQVRDPPLHHHPIHHPGPRLAQ